MSVSEQEFNEICIISARNADRARLTEDMLTAERKKNNRLMRILEAVERRCGSASRASAYTDATECAEWIREALKDDKND
jgi:hypothetical protein